MKRIRTIFLLVLLLAINHSIVYGQEAIHYVIALDCSGSMKEGDRWTKALSSVGNIQKKVCFNDKLDIVCFAEHTTRIVHDVASCQIINGENTCIWKAWQEAEKLFKPEEKVRFYLITDGLEDHGNEIRKVQEHNDLLVKKIKSFCSDNTNGGDRQGFYENLVGTLNNSNNNPIYNALLESDCFHIIARGSFVPNELTFNEVDDLDEVKRIYQKDVKYKLNLGEEIDRDIINNVYAKTNDLYFSASIEGNSIRDSQFSLIIKDNKVPDSIIQGKDFYEFKVEIGSEPNAKVIIETTDILNVRMNFYKEKIVALPEDRMDANVEWRSGCRLPIIKSLKWFSPIEPDTISVDWHKKIEFNQEAKNIPTASVHCVIDASECSLSPDKYKVFYGNKEIDSMGFLITNQGINGLKVKVNSGVKHGKYTLFVKCKGLDGIDRIQGFGNFADYSFPICFQVHQKRNWGGIVFWAIVLIILLVIWTIIYKRFILPCIIEKARLRALLAKLNQARNDFNGILSRYALDPTRNMQCGINNPMKNVLTNDNVMSFDRIPEYLVCAIFDGNHKEAVLEMVFEELNLNYYFGVLNEIKSEEDKICKVLKMPRVLQKNEKEEAIRKVKERVAFFIGNEIPGNTMLLIKRDIRQNNQTESVLFSYNLDTDKWERGDGYLQEDSIDIIFEIPIKTGDNLKIQIK